MNTIIGSHVTRREAIPQAVSIAHKRLMWALVGLGLLTRAVQYGFNRSLWLDESFLALNLMHRAYAGLLKPLDYAQGAPIGFLVGEKFVVNLLGPREYALRLFPLLCGLASVFLFSALARRFLRPTAATIAIAFFAITPHLIYYSSEVKQYSVDVFVSLLLIWFADRVLSLGLTWGRLALFSLLGAAAVWFSHTALFVLVGVGLTLAWIVFRRGRWGDLVRLGLVGLVWAASFGVCYLLFLRTLARNQELFGYWRGSFMPLPRSFDDVKWYLNSFLDMFRDPGGLELRGIGALGFILGAIALSRERSDRLLLLVSPLVLALFASAFHKYPFSGRMLLFVVPSLTLLMAEGAETLWAGNTSWKPAAWVFLALLFAHTAMLAAYRLVRPRTREEIRPVLQYVDAHQQRGDKVYSYWASEYQVRYYEEAYGLLRQTDKVVGTVSTADWRKYEGDLDKLRGSPRVWIIFTHVVDKFGVDEEKFFLYELDKRGKRLDRFERTKATAYLYDLSTR